MRSNWSAVVLVLGACGSAQRAPGRPAPAGTPAPTTTSRAPGPGARSPEPGAKTAPAPAAPSVDDQLATLGLRAYPDGDGPPIPDSWFKTRTLSPDDVRDDLSNLDDLAWLEPIARAHTALLFGESHYYQVTHHLAARVLFALNRYDHYGLVTVEQPYSLTPFLDHYVSLTDDTVAARFFDATLAPSLEVEDAELLGHVRAWNRAHPKQRIDVAAHDLEHDYDHVLRAVIAPYFAALGPSYTIDVDRVQPSDLPALADQLAGWLPAARKHRLAGDYPFVDADYVGRVIENLRSTGLAYADDGDFSYYRQRAIVRNLTDPRYLGRWFRTGKVMVWAGSHHTATTAKPDGGDFLREGAYLAHDFAPTKGKTYSISVLGFAYSLGEMAQLDPKSIGFAGTAYRNALATLHAAYAQGLVDPARAYFLGAAGNPMIDLVIALGARSGGDPVLLDSVAWDAIADAMPAARGAITDARRELSGYDAIVIVPRSPITRRR